MHSLGQRIKKLREERGWSQKHLGELMGGLAEPTISLYESGKRTPDIEKATQLAQIFNVSLDYLVLGSDNITPDDIEAEWPGLLAELRYFASKGTKPEKNKLRRTIDVFIRE